MGKTHESIMLRMGMRSHRGSTPNAQITITAIILSIRSKMHALGKFHHKLIMASVLP